MSHKLLFTAIGTLLLGHCLSWAPMIHHRVRRVPSTHSSTTMVDEASLATLNLPPRLASITESLRALSDDKVGCSLSLSE